MRIRNFYRAEERISSDEFDLFKIITLTYNIKPCPITFSLHTPITMQFSSLLKAYYNFMFRIYEK